MARLTKADAARQMGISRTTLYKLIHEGRLSVHPDGSVDTAELLRAVSTLTSSVQRERPVPVHQLDIEAVGSEHAGRPVPVHTERPGHLSSERQLTSSPVDILNTLQQTVDILQQELRAARAREEAHRDELVWLRQQFEAMQRRYDRLLEAPRPAQMAPPAPARPQPLRAPRERRTPSQTRQDAQEAVLPDAPTYDPAKFVLGRLCPRAHRYQGTAQSLRRRHNGTCVACGVVEQRERRQARREQR